MEKKTSKVIDDGFIRAPESATQNLLEGKQMEEQKTKKENESMPVNFECPECGSMMFNGRVSALWGFEALWDDEFSISAPTVNIQLFCDGCSNSLELEMTGNENFLPLGQKFRNALRIRENTQALKDFLEQQTEIIRSSSHPKKLRGKRD